MLTRTALDACAEHGIDTLLIGNGVAANSRLRAMAEQRSADAGVRLRVPRPKPCTDNGRRSRRSARIWWSPAWRPRT